MVNVLLIVQGKYSYIHLFKEKFPRYKHLVMVMFFHKYNFNIMAKFDLHLNVYIPNSKVFHFTYKYIPSIKFPSSIYIHFIVIYFQYLYFYKVISSIKVFMVNYEHITICLGNEDITIYSYIYDHTSLSTRFPYV